MSVELLSTVSVELRDEGYTCMLPVHIDRH